MRCRAFLDPYAQFARFSDGAGNLDLEEFLDAKDVVTSLSREYEACERADYVSASVLTDMCNSGNHWQCLFVTWNRPAGQKDVSIVCQLQSWLAYQAICREQTWLHTLA